MQYNPQTAYGNANYNQPQHASQGYANQHMQQPQHQQYAMANGGNPNNYAYQNVNNQNANPQVAPNGVRYVNAPASGNYNNNYNNYNGATNNVANPVRNPKEVNTPNGNGRVNGYGNSGVNSGEEKGKKVKVAPDTKAAKIVNVIAFLLSLAAAVVAGLLVINPIDKLSTKGLDYIIPTDGWLSIKLTFDPVAAITIFLPAVVFILVFIAFVTQAKWKKFIFAFISLISGAALLLFMYIVPAIRSGVWAFDIKLIFESSSIQLIIAGALCVVNFFVLFVAACMSHRKVPENELTSAEE